MTNGFEDKAVELNIGDWVMVLKVGFKRPYRIESIVDNMYTVVQTEGTYVHKVKVEEKHVKKL